MSNTAINMAELAHWRTSLTDVWPADANDPEGAWIIGAIGQDGSKYDVITVEADQYDAPGDSEKIARALITLWAQAFAAPPAAQAQPDAGLDVEAVLRQFLTGDGFIAECDIRHIVAALTAQPAISGYTCTVPDDCETLHWRGQILSMNELASVAQPAAGEEIMVNAPGDVYTLPLQPSGLSSGPRFVVHVPGPEQPEPDVSALVEALELARRTLAMAAIEGEVTRRIDSALAAHRKQGGAE